MARAEYRTAAGRFSRPCSLAECVELAGRSDCAQFVAGDTDLGVTTNLHNARFPHLISLEGVAELREFRDGPDAVEIGAGLTLTEIGEVWREAPAVFREWLALFASPLIRNRATLGGNLATASPIGDSAPLLLALDAEVRIAGVRGERVLPLAEFFTGYRKTVLAKEEIVRSVRIPKPWPNEVRFFKIAKRNLDDISTVAAGIVARGKRLTLGLGGVAAVPTRVAALDADDAMAKVASLRPIGDHRGSAEYRSAVLISLIRKFVEEAA
jgi:xanthine dehydrogenase small subunit